MDSCFLRCASIKPTLVPGRFAVFSGMALSWLTVFLESASNLGCMAQEFSVWSPLIVSILVSGPQSLSLTVS